MPALKVGTTTQLLPPHIRILILLAASKFLSGHRGGDTLCSQKKSQVPDVPTRLCGFWPFMKLRADPRVNPVGHGLPLEIRSPVTAFLRHKALNKQKESMF